jgi:hypothetical protein
MCNVSYFPDYFVNNLEEKIYIFQKKRRRCFHVLFIAKVPNPVTDPFEIGWVEKWRNGSLFFLAFIQGQSATPLSFKI